jgi:hypothetical protein
MANIETLLADTRYFVEVAAPGTPSAANVVLYAKSDGLLYSKDDAGVETLVSGGSGSGLVDQGSFTYLDATEAAAPATPAAGKVRFYSKADGLLYSKDDAGVETLVSGGAGGGGGDGYMAGYDPRRPPASVNAATDEFDDSSLDGAWTWVSAPAGTVSETEYPGWLYFTGGGDATGADHFLRRAFVPGASTEFTVAGRVRMSITDGNYSGGIGIAVLDTSDAMVANCRLYTNGTATASRTFRIFSGSTSIGTAFSGGALGGPLAEQDIWLRITRTTGNVYTMYFSGTGMGSWQFLTTHTLATSVQKVSVIYAADTDAVSDAAIDFVRVLDSVTAKIGAVAA